MHFCYIDESGTCSLPGNTSHYILAGFSITVDKWKACDKDIEVIKKRYNLLDGEVHVAWVLRSYLEQNRIPDFEKLTQNERRAKVIALRNRELLRLQRLTNKKLYKQTKKNYKKTNPYIHLTFDERKQLILDVARALSSWEFARLFAECIDKIYFDPAKCANAIDGQCFEQVTSRFEQYLQVISSGWRPSPKFGLLIHDNNETVAKKHTALMKRYHKDGTLWTKLKNIIETPLFVDSELTSMIQIADLCGYALRRYLL